jgi:hypothetical protein
MHVDEFVELEGFAVLHKQLDDGEINPGVPAFSG